MGLLCVDSDDCEGVWETKDLALGKTIRSNDWTKQVNRGPKERVR